MLYLSPYDVLKVLEELDASVAVFESGMKTTSH